MDIEYVDDVKIIAGHDKMFLLAGKYSYTPSYDHGERID